MRSQQDYKGLCNKYMRQELDGRFTHHHEAAEGGARWAALWWGPRSALPAPSAVWVPENVQGCAHWRPAWRSTWEPDSHEREAGPPTKPQALSDRGCVAQDHRAPWAVWKPGETEALLWGRVTGLRWLMLPVQLTRIFWGLTVREI